MKAVHHHLSSGDPRRANAALALLAAITARGPAPAVELVRGFDFELKALPKLARPPRCSNPRSECTVQGAQREWLRRGVHRSARFPRR